MPLVTVKLFEVCIQKEDLKHSSNQGKIVCVYLKPGSPIYNIRGRNVYIANWGHIIRQCQLNEYSEHTTFILMHGQASKEYL
jgi:hypothetical protein